MNLNLFKSLQILIKFRHQCQEVLKRDVRSFSLAQLNVFIRLTTRIQSCVLATEKNVQILVDKDKLAEMKLGFLVITLVLLFNAGMIR